MMKCYICDKDSTISGADYGRTKTVKCDRCGKYLITVTASIALGNYQDKKYILSGILRERSKRRDPIKIDSQNIDDLLNSALPPDGPLEAIDLILKFVFKKSNTFGKEVEVKSSTDYPIAYAHDEKEFVNYLNAARKLGYLVSPRTGSGSFKLTLKGWQRVDELRKIQIESDQAFIAMWFDSETDSAWNKGFKPALEATGYKPIRIDLIQHNDKIDDRIIAEIRKSGLLIADFTGNRGGVYFEAGFAKGLGIPVIWTCRKDHLDDVHFDTRQFNHIDWENPEELKDRLIDRIEATLPNRSRIKQ